MSTLWIHKITGSGERRHRSAGTAAADSAGSSARWLRSLGLVVCVAGCTGTLGDGPGGGDEPGIGTQACGTGATIDPGPSPMRLLSREQYLNTVRDLVGDVDLTAALGASSQASAFGLIQPDITQVEVESFQAAADLIAAAVVAKAGALSAIAPCSAGADQRSCARTFVQSFGTRAYRAPVADATDIDRHLALYDVGATTSYAHGIEMVLRGMLQAPRFLYRVEVGTTEKVGPHAVKLSGYEIASRLSYSLWNTAPDAKLTAAADAGTLGTKEGVSAQLGWMLEDPRGKKLLRRFLESWTHISDLDNVVKDASLFPEWQGSTLRASMQDQARSFFDYVLESKGGSLSSLLTSPTVFVNKDLGGFYGVPGGDTFQPLERNDGATSGILTLPALLALRAKPSESSPIYRGKFVREALLCQQLPAPPPNIPKPPEVAAGVSARERLEQHEVDPACSGCHKLMDPIGFGFESYDAIGRFRTTDGGKPVDAHGEVVSTDDLDGEFVGVAELGQKLANSAQVRDCVARQWFRFALSRFEQDPDTCSMKKIVDTFQGKDADLNTLPAAVVETDAFLYRRPISETPQ
jgi:hypothetical protein